MCLDIVNRGKSRKRIGYKVVIDRGGEYYTGICGGKRVKLEIGNYVRDENECPIPIRGNSSNTYPAGFHICLSLYDAKVIQRHEGGVIFKVAFRKEVAWGTTHWSFFRSLGCPELREETVVAREVKLLYKV